MRAWTFSLACLVLTPSLGCEPEPTSRAAPEAVAHEHADDERTEPTPTPGPDECGSGSAECGRKGVAQNAGGPRAEAQGCGSAEDPSGCGCGQEAPKGGDPARTRTDPDTGATVTAVGGDLKGAEAVSVSDLVNQPERFAGKTVQVSGDVTAMCTHRRAWFAVREQPSDAHYVRVLTAPSFLVPPHAVGRKARAEGRVDVIEVPERAAQHYARGHRLGDPSEVRGSRKSVVIRATGAEFR